MNARDLYAVALVAATLCAACQGPQTPPGPNAGTAVPATGTPPPPRPAQPPTPPTPPTPVAKVEPKPAEVKPAEFKPAETMPPTTTGPVTLTLKVRAEGGAVIPPRSRLVVFWSVSSGSPDYVYKFGDGEATPTGATLTLKGPPPAEALNTYGADQLGVALIVAVPENLPVLPDGRITDRALFKKYYREARLGMAANHALIWRHGAFSDARYNGRFEWPRAFGQDAVLCGDGVRRPEGERGFDWFKPGACAGIEVIFGGTLDWVNWT